MQDPTLTKKQQAAMLEMRLKQALNPTQLIIVDDSDEHMGHQAAMVGRGHFTVTIASEKFSSLSTIACHRLVYEAAGDLIPAEIHALSIKIIKLS